MYDFKRARLGMSLEEWRALPVPAQDPPSFSMIKNGPVRPICGTDAPDAYQFSAYGAERSAGVLVCGYAYQETIGSSSPSWDAATIPIGKEHGTNEVRYKFLDGRLFEISVGGSTYLLSDIVDGLTAKWGQPDRTINDTTQNKAGATFPHTEQYWENPAATIHLESPYTRIDNLNVTYLTTAGAARLNAVEKALNPDTDKM
jgi:hypothetical protein